MIAPKQVLPTIGFALGCTVLVLGLHLYAGTLIASHWIAAMTPCVACAKTFWQHLLTPSNLLAMTVFAWSGLGLIRGTLFLKREYDFQQEASVSKQYKSVFLIEQAPRAAWTTGILKPSVCIDTAFWKSLTPKERLALQEHEQHHVDHQESLLFFLLGWCTSILPLPGFSNGIRAYTAQKRIESELRADQRAIEATSNRTLASLLYKALQFESFQQITVAPAINSLIDLRLQHITQAKAVAKTQAPQQWLLLNTLLCVAILTTALFFYFEPLSSCL